MKQISIKRYLPRSLYGRAALILLVPIITLQLVVSFAFIQRFYEDVTKQMTMNLVPEIEIILDMIDNFDPNENEESDIFLLAQDFNMQASWLASHATNRRTFYDLSGRMLTNTLYENFDELQAVDLMTSDKTVILTYDISGKVLELRFSRYRISAANPHQLLVLMTLTGILMTTIAFLFMRNQLRPIKRLSAAAEAFGKGREVSYAPSGATEVRAAGRAFLNMKARIERQIEQRTLIFSGVSHDLRTPLTRLKLGLSMQENSVENQELIQDVNEMERLINEFLDFSKYGSIDETELVDPLEIINGIIENSNRTGNKLTLGETLKEKPLILLKPLSIKRAIENIVNNAEKWSSLVNLSVVLTKKSLIFRIEDNGPGIPKNQRDEAIKPFTKLDVSRNQNKGSGVGLGLAISSDIARTHGGKLKLSESTKFGGLCVEIVIPV
jgi:two-component system osmolarity sensor histidine kinase EnvZ